MPLSEQTLHPLTASSVQLSYCHDRPLRYIATRYVPICPTPSQEPDRVSCTLLFIGGISLSQETWLPVIKHLYHLTSQSTSPIRIHSAWAIERPNHGDAGVLNERELKEHYSVIFPSLQYAAAIRAFLASGTLSAHERANLIGIGHSGGGGSLIQAMEPAKHDLPLRTLILVESPHCDDAAWPYFTELYKAVKRANARRQTSWASKDDAMHWITTHAPWMAFHPDVLSIISETYFRADEEQPGRITTKTMVEQETASFLDDGTHLGALPYLRTIFHTLPTHLILGSIMDIWPPPMYKMLERNIEQSRPALASVTTLEGVGHYIPVQKPKELALEIIGILSGQAGPTSSRL
ncbi:hypothetical protein EW146_g6596 [Bondarzewia mesenterica]|uniref:AB hydrolase-1 domain-containing protein n=1 Tax=Bondarzewia mesenterica TaxID=1095465 RepID=A0A4S4LTR8_9AGAM|nr:hypothetical protein EW146_g6596 [Bondarzewia mesenterica]